MKFKITSERDADGKRTIIRFSFEPQDDDSREGLSLNAGKKNVRLSALNCRFRYPFEVGLPHPDACAFAAVKMTAPFIGSTVVMDRPVSDRMAAAIRSEYPSITSINSSATQSPPSPCPDGPVGLAFSGGSDSTATSYLLPEDTVLISLVREYHPDLGVVEKWHNGNQVSDVLAEMPDRFTKVPVFTDFPYTSLCESGRRVVWADRIWHSVPVVLVAEQLGLSSVSMGKILAAFLGNEKSFDVPAVQTHHRALFGALGLATVQPLAGASEFVSETIVKSHGHQGATLTCNFGPFKKRCMACVKCFRKSLMNHVLDGTTPSTEEIGRFNQSKRIEILSKKNPIPFTSTLKSLFDDIGMKFPGPVGDIQQKVHADYPDDPSWTRRVYEPFYTSTPGMGPYLDKLTEYAPPMTSEDIQVLTRLKVRPSR